MIYNYAKAGAADEYVVTGVDGMTLYGLCGFSEAMAREIAFHLNTAHDRGQLVAREAVKSALGLSS